jgi:hypothetical protein
MQHTHILPCYVSRGWTGVRYNVGNGTSSCGTGGQREEVSSGFHKRYMNICNETTEETALGVEPRRRVLLSERCFPHREDSALPRVQHKDT